MTASARILFVDDEPRVLKAMRAMFRREYEVELADSGARALELLAEQDFDVVVCDQRMPLMTGVEVLREARSIAPRTMRVLLTGYADLAAIEHAINEAEVFRYLMKPCPREQLQETLVQAVEAARAPVLLDRPAEPSGPSTGAASAPAAPVDEVGVLVLSRDEALADAMRDAVVDGISVCRANSLEEAMGILADRPVGVVVTDLSVDEAAIATLTSELRREAPELVTIVASDRSDAHVMIGLINRGQVFRFLLKPVSTGQSRIWLASAVNRHRELLAEPEALPRYRPEPADAAESGGTFARMLEGLRGLRSRDPRDRAGSGP